MILYHIIISYCIILYYIILYYIIIYCILFNRFAHSAGPSQEERGKQGNRATGKQCRGEAGKPLGGLGGQKVNTRLNGPGQMGEAILPGPFRSAF